MIPGTSVRAMIPCRRAIRFATRIEYVSSEPRNTVSTRLTAATASAASSAQPKLSTVSTPSVTSAAISEDRRVRDEHEQEAENQRERQPQGRHDGWDDRVERGDDHRDHERTPEALDTDPGQEARDHQQGHAHRQPRDQQHRTTAGRRPCLLELESLGILVLLQLGRGG